MKTISLCLSGLILCSLLAGGQRQETHPVPPGLRQAEKMPNPADIPPTMDPRARGREVDSAQLKRQADELAKLAQSIPAAIEQATKGRLPQDLDAQLKQIERLAKRLRHELSP